jgi:hypothetical protein
MAFDAGSIDATLTLNRNPFTAGIAAAKNQARGLERERFNVDIKVSLNQADVRRVKATLRELAKRVVATARINVDRANFDRLLRDLQRFHGRVYTARVRINTSDAERSLRGLEDQINRIRRSLDDLGGRTRRFSDDASAGFGGGASHFAKMASAIIAGAPLIASGLIGVLGAVGALGSAFAIAGAGAGAFALVAKTVFDDLFDKTKTFTGLQKEAADGLKKLQDSYAKLVEQTQVGVWRAFITNFDAARVALGSLVGVINSASGGFERIGKLAKQYFQGDDWEKFTDFLSKNTGPVLEKVFLILANATQGVMNLIMAFQPLTDWMLDALVKGMQSFAEWTERLGQNKDFQTFLEAAKRSLESMWHFLEEVVKFIYKLAVGLEPLGSIIFKVLGDIFEQLNKMPPEWIAAIAYGFGAMWAAIALGAGGPVGIAIGVLAGLAVLLADLYTKNETFRNSVNAFGADLRDYFLPIWNNIVEAFETKIIPAWNNLVAAVREHVMPVFQELWTQIREQVGPAFEHLVSTIFDRLIPAFLQFMADIMPVVSWFIKVIGTDVVQAWQIMVSTVDGALIMVTGLFQTFSGVFTGDWQTFHTGLQTIAEGFWTIVAGLFGMNLDELKAKFSEWDAWIRGLWTSLWDSVSNYLDIKLKEIQTVVGMARDGIDRTWREVANVFATPINWVINEVINKGIIGAWNTVMGWIGAPSLTATPVPNIPRFAQGGIVPGGYAPGQDTQAIMASPGEGIVRPEVTRALGPSWIDNVNTVARRAGVGGVKRYLDYGGERVQQFQGGGVVAATAFANAQAGKPYSWGGVGPGGYDCSGFMSALQNVIMGRYPHSRLYATGSFGPTRGAAGLVPGLSSAFTVGVNPNTGSGVGHMAGTLGGMNVESRGGAGVVLGGGARGSTNSLFPWHFSLPSAGGAFVDTGGGGGVALPDYIAMATDLFNKILNFDGFPGKGIFGDAIKQIPTKLVDKALAEAKKKIDAWRTVHVAGTASPAGGAAGAGVQAAVNAVAQRYGWGQGTSQWNSLSLLIQKESGWNPNAANPTSSARGLFQKMTSIHGPVEPTAAGQAEWGLKYIKDRYGTPSAALDFHNRNNYYDGGGWLMPGRSMAWNATGRPERVLSRHEYNDMRGGVGREEISDIIRTIIGELGISGGGDVFHVQLPERTTVRELADTIDFRRRVRSKGRYAR